MDRVRVRVGSVRVGSGGLGFGRVRFGWVGARVWVGLIRFVGG